MEGDVGRDYHVFIMLPWWFGVIGMIERRRWVGEHSLYQRDPCTYVCLEDSSLETSYTNYLLDNGAYLSPLRTASVSMASVDTEDIVDGELFGNVLRPVAGHGF